jgi:hypothetical protein
MRLTPFLILLLPAVALAEEPDLEALRKEARERYEKVARELPFLSAGDLILGREIKVSVPGGTREYEERIATLGFHPGSRFTGEAILPLLSHEDPRVRTLALCGLFALQDPAHLPSIHGLAQDREETFPQPETNISYEKSPWGRVAAPTLRRRTVADVARRMVDFYASRSRVRLSYHPQRWLRSFAAYYEPRAKRGSCAGWLVVRRDRGRS